MMIRYLKTHNELSIEQGLAQKSDDRPIWIHLDQPTHEEIIYIKQFYAIHLTASHSREIEIDQYHYIQAELMMLDHRREPILGQMMFVLGESILITMTNTPQFFPFDYAIRRLNRKPMYFENPRQILRVLLQIANDHTDNVIDQIAKGLQTTSDEIFQITEGVNEKGRELGVQDLLDTIFNLNIKEEFISRCLESQLSLMRVVRYLNGEVDHQQEAMLQTLVNELMGDVAEVKEYASFEYEKVRYLQHAVTNIMNIKQNQIVKVFTIITAVFLPPTLVGTFYGMNFAVMPELSWEHGFLYSMILTLLAAIMPLIYIKQKGWLR